MIILGAEVAKRLTGLYDGYDDQGKSRLSPRQQSKLIEHVVAGSTAPPAAEIVGARPNTAILFFMHLRPLLVRKLPSYRLCGEGEADERGFGGVRKGKRSRGAAGNVVVFGL